MAEAPDKRLLLDDEEVEVAVLLGVTPGTGAKEDHLGGEDALSIRMRAARSIVSSVGMSAADTTMTSALRQERRAVPA